MNKYTIKKIFEKRFSFPVWKIEVDCATDTLVVEYRDPETTLPYFSIIGFDGSSKCEDIRVDEKEWTLEALQGDFLILKRFGGSSPVEAGIHVIHYPTRQTISHYMEYVLVEVYQQTILAKHRSIPGGLTYAIDITTGDVRMQLDKPLVYPISEIKYPLPYNGHKPSFIEAIPYIETAWLLPRTDTFLWAYHTQSDRTYQLHLQLSTKTETLDSQIVLTGLERLIPQPFFEVKGRVFFLSNSKLKITAYLV